MTKQISINEQIKINNAYVEYIFLSDDSCGLSKQEEEKLQSVFWDVYQPIALSICQEANTAAGEAKWAVDPILRIVERDTIPQEYASVYVVPEGGSHD